VKWVYEDMAFFGSGFLYIYRSLLLQKRPLPECTVINRLIASRLTASLSHSHYSQADSYSYWEEETRKVPGYSIDFIFKSK
jgi:hypothetical protein